MKKILTLILLLKTIICSSQSLNISYSNEFPKNKAGGNIYPFKNKYFGYYTDYKKTIHFLGKEKFNMSHSVEFSAYDENLKEIKTAYLQTEERIFGPYKSKIFAFNDKIHFLYSKYSVKKDSIEIFHSNINFETFELENTERLTAFPILDNWKENINTNSFYIDYLKMEVILNEDLNKVMLFTSSPNYMFSCFLNNNSILKKQFTKLPIADTLKISKVFFDEDENRYVGYKKIADNVNTGGVIIIDKNNAILEKQFNIEKSNSYTTNIQFHKSKDKSKIFVYANYNSKDDEHGIVLNTINTNDFSLGKQDLIPYNDTIMKTLYSLTVEGKKNKQVIEINYDFGLFETQSNELILYALLRDKKYFGGSNTTDPHYTDNCGPIMQIYKSNNNKCMFSFNDRSDNVIALLLKDTILYLDIVYNFRLAYLTKNKKYEKGYNSNLLIGRYVSYDGRLLKMEPIGETIPSKYEHYLDRNRLIGKNKYMIPMIESAGSRISKYAIIEVN